MLGISIIKIIRWLCKISNNNFNELGLIVGNLLFSKKEKIRMEQFYLVKLFIRKDSYLKLDDYEINTLLKLDNLKILEYVTYVDDSILQKKYYI